MHFNTNVFQYTKFVFFLFNDLSKSLYKSVNSHKKKHVIHKNTLYLIKNDLTTLKRHPVLNCSMRTKTNGLTPFLLMTFVGISKYLSPTEYGPL